MVERRGGGVEDEEEGERGWLCYSGDRGVEEIAMAPDWLCCSSLCKSSSININQNLLVSCVRLLYLFCNFLEL